MESVITQGECEVLKRQYHSLLTQGYHPKVARRIVCGALAKVLRRRGVEVSDAGVGQSDPTSVIRQAADIEPIRKARETVSPWLWVLSVIGFGMTVLNTRRIARMFKNWKAKGKKAAS